MAISYQKIKNSFKLWLAAKTEHCKDIVPLFSYAYDRKLTLMEKLRVKLHLFTCGPCRDYVSNLKFLHGLFPKKGEGKEDGPIRIKLPPETKEKMKSALKAARR